MVTKLLARLLASTQIIIAALNMHGIIYYKHQRAAAAAAPR